MRVNRTRLLRRIIRKQALVNQLVAMRAVATARHHHHHHQQQHHQQQQHKLAPSRTTTTRPK